MISRKELGYVGLWANRVPYPGDTYCEESMKKLKQAFELFNKYYLNTKYNITFSNNEEIELEILAKNICHMLGIDFKNLSNDCFKDFREKVLGLNTDDYIASYTMLESIINNYKDVINFDKTSDYLKAINYYKISVKSDIFAKLGDLSHFKYGCINFDKNEFSKNNDRFFNPKSNKFLYIPSDEAVSPYFLIGILQKDNQTDLEDTDSEEIKIINNPYIVETAFAPDNPKPFFNNQEVVIPTQVLKDNNKELIRVNATPTQKKDLLKEYRNIITQYNIDNRINIYSDYFSILSEQEKVLSKTI